MTTQTVSSKFIVRNYTSVELEEDKPLEVR